MVYEPSIMLLNRPSTKTFNADINLKVQRSMEFGSVYAGLSYRTGISNGEFSDTNNVNNIVSGEPLRYITLLQVLIKVISCWLTLILINPILSF